MSFTAAEWTEKAVDAIGAAYVKIDTAIYSAELAADAHHLLGHAVEAKRLDRILDRLVEARDLLEPMPKYTKRPKRSP